MEPQSRVDGTLHIWELNRMGKPGKWIGQWPAEPKDAFMWMDRNKGRDKYVLNNIPPVTSRMQNPARAQIVTPQGVTDAGPLPRKSIPGKTDVKRAPMSSAMREQHATKGKGNPRQNRGGKSPVFGRVEQQRRAVPRDNSPEAVALRKQAAEALDQHKADEAKDLAEGRNN